MMPQKRRRTRRRRAGRRRTGRRTTGRRTTGHRRTGRRRTGQRATVLASPNRLEVLLNLRLQRFYLGCCSSWSRSPVLPERCLERLLGSNKVSNQLGRAPLSRYLHLVSSFRPGPRPPGTRAKTLKSSLVCLQISIYLYIHINIYTHTHACIFMRRPLT